MKKNCSFILAFILLLFLSGCQKADISSASAAEESMLETSLVDEAESSDSVSSSESSSRRAKLVNDIPPEYERYLPYAVEYFTKYYGDTDWEQNNPVFRSAAVGTLNGATQTAVIWAEWIMSAPANPTILLLDDGKNITGIDLRCVCDVQPQFADIDGDGSDELILHMDLGGNASAALSYDTCIYRIEEQTLVPVFESKLHHAPFDSGFRIKLEKGVYFVVENVYTGDRWRFAGDKDWQYPLDPSISLHDQFRIFDENGDVHEDYRDEVISQNVDSGNFQYVGAADIDGDGTLEIITEEMIILLSRFRYGGVLGWGYSAMKYNPDSGKMEVIDTAFLNFLALESDEFLDHEELRTEFRENWLSGL